MNTSNVVDTAELLISEADEHDLSHGEAGAALAFALGRYCRLHRLDVRRVQHLVTAASDTERLHHIANMASCIRTGEVIDAYWQ